MGFNDPIETFKDEGTGLVAKVGYDMDGGSDNPRDWDNGWLLIGFHNSRRTFGDEQIDPEELMEHDEVGEDGDLVPYLKREYEAHLIVPIYFYEHGLVQYTASNPNDAWDSGGAGVAVVNKATLEEEWDGDEEKALECLKGELETFTDWCNGSIYEYVVEDAEGELIDSCGGMYGLDYAEGEAKEALEGAVAAANKETEQARYWLERGVETVK